MHYTHCQKDKEARPGKLQISIALSDIGEHWRGMYFHTVCHCFVGDSSYNRTDNKERYLFSIYD